MQNSQILWVMKLICDIEWFSSCHCYSKFASVSYYCFISFSPKQHFLYYLLLKLYLHVDVLFEEFIYRKAKVHLSQIL